MGSLLSREKRKRTAEPTNEDADVPVESEEQPTKRFKMTKGDGDYSDFDMDFSEEEIEILDKFRAAYLKQFPKGYEGMPEHWTNEADLSMLFQKYRPDGAGIESLLGVSGHVGKEIATKMKRDLFKKTAAGYEELEEGDIPAYFTPVPKDQSDKKIKRSCEKWMENLVKMYDIASGDFEWTCDEEDVKEFVDKLREGEVNVVIRKEEDFEEGKEIDDRMNSVVEQMVVDGILSNLECESDIFVLWEAFYSIASDIMLALYFQWPLYKSAFLDVAKNSRLVDPLKPYYELWSEGVFTGWEKDGDSYNLVCYVSSDDDDEE